MLNLPKSLKSYGKPLLNSALPAAAFVLDTKPPTTIGCSKIGGLADVPRDFVWPVNKERPLDFLLQVRLSDIAGIPLGDLPFPRDGVLSFFYDLEEMPWGYYPSDLSGYRVFYFPNSADLQPAQVSAAPPFLEPRLLSFNKLITLPHFGERVYHRLVEQLAWPEAEVDAYHEFYMEHHASEKANGGRHRLFGHSENVQGDMQLEAQLVMNGLYCGNSTGYNDPRRAELEAACEDWILLLQLDSDDDAGFMWGDSGMLYYWIRRQDLKALRFDRVWMTLQCC